LKKEKILMAKIVIIGAGSGFGQRLSLDIMAYPELHDGTISLVDINQDHLTPVVEYVQKAAEVNNVPMKIEGATDRCDVLEGADYVIIAISVGGPAYDGAPYYHEVMIPKSYGVDQSVADTITPGGIFRTLRCAPVMLDICRDVERMAPDALILNYTNPMAMLCWILSEATNVKIVGLCHSVQGTSRQLAGYINAPYHEVSYWVAGINHMAWFLEFKWNGEDAYPLLRKAMEDPEIYAKNTVRFDIMKHFDYFVTESTHHMSEYVPYYRKNKEVMDQFGLGSRTPNKVVTGGGRWQRRSEQMQKQMAGEEPIVLRQSNEYASNIIYACETDNPVRINGNVMNKGIITNLLEGCCVEVPCLVDKTGVRPCSVGEIPSQLAALNMSNVAVQELTVQAVLEKDLRKAYYAMLVDPLTATVCTTEQINQMFHALVEAEGDLIDYIK
jgi:alpha-galactosidase